MIGERGQTTMPKGPNGEWRPADPVARAVHVMKIATGQIAETYAPPPRPNPAADSRRASLGGKARAAALSPARRREIAAAGSAAARGS